MSYERGKRMTVVAFDVHVGKKYQVVIPRAVRETLRLEPGDILLFIVDGDDVTLRSRPASFTAALRGLHSHLWSGDPDAWLEEQRQEWE
jgi:AbrB family looped-hinge helix DNA binding protein